MPKPFSYIWTALLDLVFPPKCPFCASVLERPRDPVCPRCQPRLPWLEHKEARRKVDFTQGCWSPLQYRDGVVDCIHRYKFTPVPAYGRPLGVLMAQCVRDHGEIAPDLVVWAPLSRKSLRKRGFDQAELLARTVGEELGLPVCPALVKVRDTARQSRLKESAQRRANIQGAYALGEKISVAGRDILLVDDVVTSGSTLSACARVLQEGGAARVWCVTLAQAGK